MIAAGDEQARASSEASGCHPVVNQAPHLGLSHSLRIGLESLEQHSWKETGAALVFLADQPLVRLGVVEALVSAWKAGGRVMVRPRYEATPDIPGHPVLLDRSIWPLVQRLHGDRGFAGVLDSISQPIMILNVAGDNPDIDTPADLRALEELTR